MNEWTDEWTDIDDAEVEEGEAVILWLPGYRGWVKGCWYKGGWVDFETLDSFELADGGVDNPTHFIIGPPPPLHFEGE